VGSVLGRLAAVVERARDAGGAALRGAINSQRLWEPEIRRYECSDRRQRPPRGGIVFTGSSTIRFWRTLAQDMAPLPVINRGFGGAHLAHVNAFAPRILLPYAPAAVVLYCGDNDLGAWTGKRPETIMSDFTRFVSLVHGALPEARIYFVSIKPSRLRRKQWPAQQEANRAIADLTRALPRVAYVDVATPMLGGAPQPPRDLFTVDGLHLSRAGYALWTSVLRPILLRDLADLDAH
jgi:lysophospholipase L1-like esterase